MLVDVCTFDMLRDREISDGPKPEMMGGYGKFTTVLVFGPTAPGIDFRLSFLNDAQGCGLTFYIAWLLAIYPCLH